VPKGTGLQLLDVNLGAGGFELLLQRFGVGLVHAVLHGLRRAFDQVLGFLQAQAGDFADDLDDFDLLLAESGQNDGELGLLFDRGGGGSGRASGDGDRGGSRNAELLFHHLDQLDDVHDGLGGDRVKDFLIAERHG